MAASAVAPPTTITDRRHDITTAETYERESVSALAPEIVADKFRNLLVTVRTGRQTRQLALRVSYPMPLWLEPSLKRAANLLELPDNWNREGAPMIENSPIQASIYALSKLLQENSSVPGWSPTARGGVQLDWHENGVDLEIAFEPGDPDGYAVFEDSQNRFAAWDGRVEDHIPQLRNLFSDLLAVK